MPTRWIGPLPAETDLDTGAGRLRVHIGMLPGCGQVQGLVRAYRLANEQNQQVMVLPSLLGPDDGWVLPTTERFDNLQADRAGLWNPAVVEAIVKEEPNLLILDSLNRYNLTLEQHEAQRAAIEQLLKMGISIETTVDLVAITMFSDLLNPPYHWPEAAKVSMKFLRLTVSDYVVHDVPPTLMLQRFYEGRITLPPPLHSQRAIFANVANLSRLREALFIVVGNHVTDQVRATNPELSEIARTRDVVDMRGIARSLGIVMLIGAFVLAGLHYLWLHWYLSLSAVSLVLLGGVVFTAFSQSFPVVVASSIMAFLALDYLFLSPFGQNPLKVEDVLTLGVFLIVGVVTGYFTSRRQRMAARDRTSTSQYRSLFRLSHDLTSAETVEECMHVGVKNLSAIWGSDVFIVLETGDGEKVYPETSIGEADRSAIDRVVASNSFSRAGGPQQYSYCPLAISGRVVGAIGLSTPSGRDTLDPTFKMLNFLRDYANLLTGALVRTQLKTVSSEASNQATRESLRSALLSSISHDLKTPLVSIIGGLSTLEHAGKGLPVKDQQELVSNARQEAERLHSVIHNVLEVTRLESGSLEPKREAVAVTELLNDAAKRARRYYKGLDIIIDAPARMPDIWVDPILTGQVFYNLLDNAAKHAGNKGKVEVGLEPNGSTLTIHIADHGPGVKTGEEEKIFDKFFRSEKHDHKNAGSGLGLAICRGIVEAHGGKIAARNRGDGRPGAVFTVQLPLAPVAAEVPHVSTHLPTKGEDQ
ncbi:MAG TPA: ATP-binding protein [Alphaproteobacteria bacterium]|nr:ATP-binding protein [Alphaproteobacteria bacterium]